MNRELKTAPLVEPITLAQVKEYAFINTDKKDSQLTSLIPAARSWIESKTGRVLVNQEWYIYYSLPEFMNVMNLEDFNVNTINEVITYDRDNTSTVVDNSLYRLGSGSSGLIQSKIIFNDDLRLNYNFNSLRSMDAVRIEVAAGFGADETEMPEDILSALAQLINYWSKTNPTAFTGQISNEVALSINAKISKYNNRLTKGI